MEILETIGITKRYGEGASMVYALKDVSVKIEKGEFAAITGASGSGKSTLLHIMGGIDKPTSGKVILNGENIYKLSEKELALLRRRKIGIIYQFYNLIPTLTVEENILLPLRLDKQKIDSGKFKDILESIRLQDRKGHLPSQLSGGQQQRCAIGRALINSPDIILADEPTGNLDSNTGHEIVSLLKSCCKNYTRTLMVITHDDRIAAQADRVITISDGEII